MPPEQINIIPSYKIDKEKWDDCIASADNSMIYAYSFYLDVMCNEWNALIGGNYDWVLPITNRKKWTIEYLYQPAFIQQLGVFSKINIAIPWPDIWSILGKRYKFWEINFNYLTPVDIFPSTVKISNRTNFILDLARSYNTISSNYKMDLIKNLKRSSRFNLYYTQSNNFEKAIQFYRNHYSHLTPHVTTKDYQRFSIVCKKAMEQGRLLCREVTNVKNECYAIALLLKDDKRLYNIMNTTTNKGRASQANHYLMDRLIKEFSQQNLLLDFEGSNLPNVKAFYQKFGVVDQPYFFIKYNQLNWPLRILK